MQVLVPLSEPLTEQQRFDAYGLEKSCQQAEDALSQGMEKLQQMLSDSVGPGQLVEGTHIPQMDTAMERLEALVSFVNQVMHMLHFIHTHLLINLITFLSVALHVISIKDALLFFFLVCALN